VHQVEQELGMTLGQIVALPLLFEDDFLGLIYLFRGSYAFSQFDWQFLQGFAEQAAIAVRNARLYSLLRTERSRLIAILENSADGIMILTRDRIVVAINHTLATMVGWRRKMLSGGRAAPCCRWKMSRGRFLSRRELHRPLSTRPILRCEGELIRPGDKRWRWR
jgi:PAS domain S-box-containing protein